LAGRSPFKARSTAPGVTSHSFAASGFSSQGDLRFNPAADQVARRSATGGELQPVPQMAFGTGVPLVITFQYCAHE